MICPMTQQPCTTSLCQMDVRICDPEPEPFSARLQQDYIALREAASDLHDYLWENVPDLITIKGVPLAGEGLRKRLQALKDVLNDPPPQRGTVK